MPSHRQIDHTADLALEIRADSEEELLAEGARAIVGLLTEGAVLDGVGPRRLELTAFDPEDRLVQFLNEVLLLATVDGFAVTAADVRLNGDGLVALLTGMEDALDRIAQELKSVTYHDLALEERPDGWFARIVIDV